MFQPIKNEKIYVTVMRQVKALIKNGDLAPGDRLPPERELASMLAVSRASVRQAIAALEAQGIVDMRQGDGTYVVEPTSVDKVIESFSRFLTEEQISPEEILQTRVIVECATAQVCAERVTGELVARLRSLLERKRIAEGRGGDLADMNHDLHVAIAEGTGNRALIKVMQVLLEMMRSNMWPRLKEMSENRESRIEEHLDQHEGIVEAIAAGRGHLAHERMREHLETIGREMQSDLEGGRAETLNTGRGGA